MRGAAGRGHRAAGALELDTFGALTTAGGIYRSLGFQVVRVEETEMWGPRIAYQHYVLDL